MPPDQPADLAMFTSLNPRSLNLPLTAAETVELAARHGYGGVDLLVRDLLERGEEPAQIRDQIAKNGLRPGAWPLPVQWRTDKATFDRDMAALPWIAKAASDIGLMATCTWVEPAADDQAEAIQKHRTRLPELAKRLGEHGIRLGFEVIGVESFRKNGMPLYHRLGSSNFRELYEEIYDKCPNVGLTVDAFHLYAGDESHEAWEQFGIESVVWAHVSDLPSDATGARKAIQDLDRGLPGEHGAVDSRGLLRRLANLGYKGPVTAEPMPSCRSFIGCDRDQVALRTIRALNAVWPQ